MVGTRSSNANSHPGKIVAPRPRRSSKQVTDVKEAAKRAKEQKAAAKAGKIDALVEMEMEMQDRENTTRAQRSQRSKRDAEDRASKKSQTKKRKRSPTPSEVYTNDEEGGDAMEIDVEGSALTPLASIHEDDEPDGELVGEKSAGDESDESDESDASGSQYVAEPAGDDVQEDSSEDTSDEDVEDTPMPAKKKPKVSKAESLRESVQAAKAGKAQAGRVQAAKEQPGAVQANKAKAPIATEGALSKGTATVKQQSGNRKGPNTEGKPSSSVSASRTLATPATPYAGAAEKPDRPKPRPVTAASKAAKMSQADGKGTTSTKQKKSKAVVEVKPEPVSDAEVGGSGYIATEDEGVEADAAENSPVKNGSRLTSAGLVKIATVDLATPSKKKSKSRGAKKRKSAGKGKEKEKGAGKGGYESDPIEIESDSDTNKTQAPPRPPPPAKVIRSSAKNSDLPRGATVNNAWKKRFLPTFLCYVGTLDNCWNILDATLVDLLQQIWDAVYGDSVVAVATQRMYEWRAAFGSAALRIFETFFKGDPEKYATAKARAEYCAAILVDCKLFYEDPDKGDEEGLYQSQFVRHCLASHMEAIQGAIDVPGLYASDADDYPFGAIGLAASAVYRAASLWKMGRVTYDKENRPVASKGVNAQTGKDSTKDVEFSIANYGTKTAGGASSARALPQECRDTIVRLALECAQAPASLATAFLPQKENELDFSRLVERRRK